MKIEYRKGRVKISCVSLETVVFWDDRNGEKSGLEILTLNISRLVNHTWLTVHGASFQITIPLKTKRGEIRKDLKNLLRHIKEPITQWYDEQHHCWLDDPVPVCLIWIKKFFY
jgi:hypothetical protein